MVMLAFNPSLWVAEAGGSLGTGQNGLHEECQAGERQGEPVSPKQI